MSVLAAQAENKQLSAQQTAKFTRTEYAHSILNVSPSFAVVLNFLWPIRECHVHALNKLFYRVKLEQCIHLNSNLMRHIFSNGLCLFPWLAHTLEHLRIDTRTPSRRRQSAIRKRTTITHI